MKYLGDFKIINKQRRNIYYRYSLSNKLTINCRVIKFLKLILNYLNTFLLLLLVLANYSNLYLTHFKKRRK